MRCRLDFVPTRFLLWDKTSVRSQFTPASKLIAHRAALCTLVLREFRLTPSEADATDIQNHRNASGITVQVERMPRPGKEPSGVTNVPHWELVLQMESGIPTMFAKAEDLSDRCAMGGIKKLVKLPRLTSTFWAGGRRALADKLFICTSVAGQREHASLDNEIEINAQR